MRSLLYSLVLSALPIAAVADSMRCGKWVVDEQAVPAEILKKCGEPSSKQVTTQDVVGKNALGNPIKLGTMITERWRYQRSTRALPMTVTIVDGKVKTIERQ